VGGIFDLLKVEIASLAMTSIGTANEYIYYKVLFRPIRPVRQIDRIVTDYFIVIIEPVGPGISL